MDLAQTAVFWIGLAGIVATAATAVVAQLQQSKRLKLKLAHERARSRYDELRWTYRSASLALTRATTMATQPALREILLPDGSEVIDFLDAPMFLRMAGASDDVMDTLEAYVNRLEKAQGRGSSIAKQLDEEVLRARQREFVSACASHLDEIWPARTRPDNRSGT